MPCCQHALAHRLAFRTMVAAVFLVSLALLFATAGTARAEEGSPISLTAEIPPEQVSITDTAHDGEDLLAGYAEQSMLRELPTDELFAQNAGKSLSGIDAIAYALLKPQIEDVAAGRRTSSVFVIPTAELAGKTSFSAADLGVESVFVDEAINPAAAEAMNQKIDFDLNIVMDALLADCPYDLYWHDKLSGVRTSYPSLRTTAEWGGSGYIYGLEFVGDISVSMSVSAGYATGTYEVDPSQGTRVQAAVATAQQIVADSTGLAAYEQLAYFKSSICSLVSYDSIAAAGGVAFGDPWQLVSVFDGDTSTNVVCEGYAKAFKYLCDLAAPSRVECLIVSGVMSGGTGAGPHMWNVVRMDDQRNYLVDVTNCDTGSVGADDLLFLVPYSSGSLASGYTFKAGRNSISYVYDEDMIGIFSTEDLTISSTPYTGSINPTPEPVSMDEVTIAPIPDQLYCGEAIEPVVEVSYEDTTLQEGTDYTVSFASNVNAGTATVTLTGMGDYTGTVTCTFAITRRALTITSASSVRVYNGRDLVAHEVTVTGDGLVSGEELTFTFSGMQHDVGSSDNTFDYAFPAGESAGNYDVTVVYGTLAVTHASATVACNDAKKEAGQDDPELTANVEGLMGSDTLAYTVQREPGEEPGTYAIHATGEQYQGNYEVAYLDGTFTIEEHLDDTTVIGIEYIPVKPFELIEGFGGYPIRHSYTSLSDGTSYFIDYWYRYSVMPQIGDQLVVRYPKGSRTYAYSIVSEGGYSRCFVNGDDRIMPTIADDQDPRTPWSADNPGTMIVTYEGCQTSVPITLRRLVDHVEFEPAQPVVFVEPFSWPSNFDTLSPAFKGGTLSRGIKTGDAFVFTLIDGSVERYIYGESNTISGYTVDLRSTDIDFSEAEIEWSSYEEGQDKQGLAEFRIGMFPCELSFTVKPNEVTSIEYLPVTPISLKFEVDGWWSTESVRGDDGTYHDEKWFWYNYLPQTGDKLVEHKRDGSTKTYVYDAYESSYMCGDEGILGMGVDIGSNQSYKNQWSPNNPCEFIVKWHGCTCIVPATVSEYEFVAITFETDGVFRTIDDRSDLMPTFIPGDRMLLTMRDGSTNTYEYAGGESTGYFYAKLFRNVDNPSDVIYLGDIYVSESGDGEQEVTLGTHTVTLKYGGCTCDLEVEVVKGLSHAEVSGSLETVYTGEPFRPHLTIKIDDTELVEGVDYELGIWQYGDSGDYHDTISYDEIVNVGTYFVQPSGLGLYEGQIMAACEFKVGRPNTLDVQVESNSISVGPADGSTQTIALNMLVSGGQGDVSYENVSTDAVAQGFAIDSESGTLTIPTGTPAGKYEVVVKVAAAGDSTHVSGNQTVTFDVLVDVTDLSGATIDAIPDQQYTGKKICPKPAILLRGVSLVEGQDYEFSYKDNVDVGTATLSVTGVGSYVGVVAKTFEIVPSDITGFVPESFSTTYVPGKDPTVALSLEFGEKSLVEGEDYVVTYGDIDLSGEVAVRTVTVEGKGNFDGTVSSPLYIHPYVAGEGDVTVSEIAQQEYTGKAITPTVSVSVCGTEVPVAWRTLAYGSNVNAGTAHITITLGGLYEGVASSAFQITPAKISSAAIAKIADQAYNGGNAVKPAPKVTWGGATLKSGTDYTVSYSNNTKETTSAKVTVTGKGNFTGTKSATFTIKYKKPTWSGATKMPVKSTATYTVTNGGYIRVKVNGKNAKSDSVVSISGKTVTAKATGTTTIYLLDSKGKQIATKKVTVFKPSGKYEFQSVLQSDLVLDIQKGSTANDARMLVWTRKSGSNTNQQYELFLQSDGTYAIRSVKSKKWLMVKDSSTEKRGQVVQHSWISGKSMRWNVKVNADNSVTFVNANSGMVFDVQGGKAKAGAFIIQWDANGGKNQKWMLVSKK